MDNNNFNANDWIVIEDFGKMKNNGSDIDNVLTIGKAYQLVNSINYINNDILIRYNDKFYISGWHINDDIKTMKIRKATDEEIKDSLISIATDYYGYKPGIKIKSLFNIKNDIIPKIDDDRLIFEYYPKLYKKHGDISFEEVNNLLCLNNVIIYHNGKWAEIISEPEIIEVFLGDLEYKYNKGDDFIYNHNFGKISIDQLRSAVNIIENK